MRSILFALILILVMPLQGMAQKTYIVKKGDNLYRISKRFNISVEELKEVNDLHSNKIKIGLKLIIPDEKYGEDNPLIPDDYSSPSTKQEEITYTVQKGDTLWTIAKRYNLSIKELKRLNNIKSNRIKPEQRLIVGYNIVKDNTEPETLVEMDESSQSVEIQSTNTKEKLILFAKKMLGISYKFNNPFNIVDCSSFVQRVFESIGMSLPRTAREQFNMGIPVNKEELSIGDLIFFKTYAPFPSHVGIYIGDDLFIHTSTIKKKVAIDNLNTPYYLKRFIGAKRLAIDESE